MRVFIITLALLALSSIGFAQGVPPVLKNVTMLVIIGDSLTDGAAWPDWMVNSLRAAGATDLTLHNAAICGETIAGIKARYVLDVLSLKPQLVIICIGTNDAIRGVTPDAFRRDLDEVVTAIRAASAEVLLLTPPFLEKPEYNQRLVQLNAVIADVALARGCRFGDLHADCAKLVTSGTRIWGDDGVHHVQAGWRQMARSTLDALGCAAPLREEVHPYPGAVLDWLVSPAFPWKTGQPVPAPDLSPRFNPRRAGWTVYDTAAELKQAGWWAHCMLQRGGVMPFGDPVRVKDSAAYALADITAKKAGPVTLHVGGSPPMVVWLNGVKVFDDPKAHGWHPDAQRFTVTLKRGKNRLIVFTNYLAHVSVGE
jgi:lysophospholipase L1-like esterase